LRELLLMLTKRALEARWLLLNRGELLRSWVGKWATSIVHKLLLLHARLHGVLETALRLVVLLHAIELESSGLRHHPHILLAVLGRIETSELLAHSHFV
jgi:hypothetical protein